MHLNSLGNLIALQLAAVSDYYNNIQIVHSIIMPNHIHFILSIETNNNAI